MTNAATDGPDETGSFIRRLYQSILRREIRDDELQSWLAALDTGSLDLLRVADLVMASTEAVGKSGTARVIETRADFATAIGHLYQAMLGRTASEDDIDLWWSAHTTNAHAISSVIIDISTSDEAKDYRALPRPETTGEPALSAAYRTAFNTPAQHGDVARWIGKLASELECLATGMASVVIAPDTGERVGGAVGTATEGPAGGSTNGPGPASVESTEAISGAVRHLYQLAFQRVARPEEVAHWVAMVQTGALSTSDLVASLATSAEAVEKRSSLPDLSDGTFFQISHEVLLERGAMPGEIAEWQRAVAAGESDRVSLERSLFLSSARASAANATPPGNDASRTYLLGRGQYVSRDDWNAADDAGSQESRGTPTRQPASYPVTCPPAVLVSAIASLYEGAAFIEKFLSNITAQTIFESHSELIIVDAHSPQNERAVIEPYLQRYKNIHYVRCPNRIGIYDAWNIGLAMASGRYITNTNLDDLRRADSFELQAGVLENLAFVDIVYQDVFYSFDPNLSFEQVAARGFTSNVPIITPQNLLEFNLPHNAPMWRRALHADVGTFDTAYKSAGDYEFWLRCLKAKKSFFKINDPHVVYFVNPVGMSTRPDTSGLAETNRISRSHARSMVSHNLTCAPPVFLAELGRLGGSAGHRPAVTTDEQATDKHWRYAAVQTALRELSIASRLDRTA